MTDLEYLEWRDCHIKLGAMPVLKKGKWDMQTIIFPDGEVKESPLGVSGDYPLMKSHQAIHRMLEEGYVFPVPTKEQLGECLMCSRYGKHRHHVVYSPRPYVVRLCTRHHKDITAVNINEASRRRARLPNWLRWSLWYRWLDGTVKPVRDANVKRWLDRW